jgi:RNA-directed DNA polymerase
MTTRQEKSDGRTVPQDRRKAVPTARPGRGGKATTASEVMGQLELLRGTAESPRGTNRKEEASQVAAEGRKVPKPRTTKRRSPSAMTMEEIANEALLREAFAKVASNKGAPGPDRQSVAEVQEYLDDILSALSTALLDGSYRPGVIRRVWIPKPGGDQRGLGIPNVIDRLVQQAVHLVLSPHFEPKFHEMSHGFRPGRSCHTAIEAAREHMQQGCSWVVDIDLEKFFDRVHHERLLARLQRMGVNDRRVLQLIRRMLKAKVVMPDGVVVSTEEGAPQGGPLSPLLSNVVLDELDWELERRGHRFVRYADDCNVYVSSLRAGHRVMTSLTWFIEKRLRLQVNQAKSAVAKPSTRHFVGFRLERSKKGVIQVRLSKRSNKRIRRRIVELTRRNWGGSLVSCIERVNTYLDGWIGFFGIVDRAELFGLGTIDAHVRRRLRALVFRQKKRRRYIVTFLRKRRVPKKQALIDVYGRHRGLWALSITKSAHKAMSSYWFDNQGLVRLKRLWAKRHEKLRPVTAPAQLTLGLE